MLNGKGFISAVALAWCTMPACGQSFNVDVGTAISGTPGFGAPSSGHGGAANQPGVWNNITGTTVGPISLVTLDGSATAATLTRSSGLNGDFGFNNANTSGDFQLLLDDGQDLGSLASPAVTYTFSNLAHGTYDVYSYAVGPDNAAFVTSVTIGGLTQNVGGAIPLNAYAQGVTHALHASIEIGALGVLSVAFDVVTVAGTTNGLQLVYTPPVAQCIGWRAGPFFGNANTNGIGDSLSCVSTWDPDGDGPQLPVLVVGGDFNTGPNNAVTGGIATYNAITNTWQQIGSMPYDEPYVLRTYNNDLIVGGDFTYMIGLSACNIARWNGSSWQGFGSTCDFTHGPVRSLMELNGELIVGEQMSEYAVDVNLVWRWTPGNGWQEMSAGEMDQDQESGDFVGAFAYYNGALIAGGNLPGDVMAMQWAPPTGWLTIFPGCSFSPDCSVYACQGFNSQLVAAGSFGNGSIARWNGSQWMALGSGLEHVPNYSGFVHALTVYNGELIAGGSFSFAGGLPANNIALWNGTAWQPLGSGIQEPVLGGTVRDLAVYNGHLYAVGDFSIAGGFAANNIARWDGTSWSPILIGNTTNGVFAMTTFGSHIVAGGDFQQTTTGGTPARNIARNDGVETSTLGTGMNATVTALKSFNYPGPLAPRELVAGGLFTIAGGVSANYIARWVEDPILVPQGWQSMGAGFNSGVYAVERFLNETIASGAFTASGGTAVSRIAKWNEVSDVWQPMGPGFGGGMNGSVRALKGIDLGVLGNSLVAGGDFTTAGGVPANRIAQWNSFDSIWAPMAAGFNGSVHAIEYHNFAWYAGGGFTASGATTLNRVAFYVPFQNSWFPVGNGIGFNGTVKALKSVGNLLYAAGQFTSVDGISANHIAVWDGSSWAAVQGGANDWILALGLFHNEIHAGGLFTTVGSSAIQSPGWAMYSQTGAPWIASQPLSATVPCGQIVQFSLTPASGYDPLTYSWRKAGTPLSDGPTGHGSTISGATGPSITISNVASEDAGSYDCVITNACGSATSAAATLTVTGTCPSDCIADIAPAGSPDGAVNVTDLLAVIGAWGTCPDPDNCPADIAPPGGNDVVNVDDLLGIISAWGLCP